MHADRLLASEVPAHAGRCYSRQDRCWRSDDADWAPSDPRPRRRVDSGHHRRLPPRTGNTVAPPPTMNPRIPDAQRTEPIDHRLVALAAGRPLMRDSNNTGLMKVLYGRHACHGCALRGQLASDGPRRDWCRRPCAGWHPESQRRAERSAGAVHRRAPHDSIDEQHSPVGAGSPATPVDEFRRAGAVRWVRRWTGCWSACAGPVVRRPSRRDPADYLSGGRCPDRRRTWASRRTVKSRLRLAVRRCA